jgi:hypothetical protein
MSNLKASYTFFSDQTGNTYVLSVQTGPLTPIRTLDNPNCIGWPIISGSFIVIAGGQATTYNVPGGQTVFLYNGLWESADASPDGKGSPWCNGIDRLFISFSQQTNNTLIAATNSNSINIVNGTLQDNATLLKSIFPPK